MAIAFFDTQTMHFKSMLHIKFAMLSLKTLYPGGIQTRVLHYNGLLAYLHLKFQLRLDSFAFYICVPITILNLHFKR
jgi:hypothetical protein